MSLRAGLLLLTGSFVLFGCEPESKKNARNTGDCVDRDGLQTCRYTETSNDGYVPVYVNVNGGAGSFLVTARGPDDTYLATETITNPDGDVSLSWEDWYYGENNLTAGILPLYAEMQTNWPVRAEDEALSAGLWEVGVVVIDYEGYYLDGQDIELVTQVKQDDAFSDGNVNVRIVYVEGLDGDADVVAATEAAVDLWRVIWGAYGVTLTVVYDAEADISASLPAMSEGSADIEAISAGGTDSDVTVVIGESVGGAFNIYGESGGIPGTLVANEHSAVGISWITNAGGDGVFSDDDIRVYGETLAHEVGHYMGLFHPVDYDNRSNPYAWDALSDTEECGSQSVCDDALGENNMYPFPVCPDFNFCYDQQTLTGGQSGVVHRHTGAL